MDNKYFALNVNNNVMRDLINTSVTIVWLQRKLDFFVLSQLITTQIYCISLLLLVIFISTSYKNTILCIQPPNYTHLSYSISIMYI